MAIGVCFQSEHSFYSTLLADEKLFRHSRYTDDAFGIVAYDKTSKKSLREAKSLVHKFANTCFPKELVFEDEKIANGALNFLEGGLKVEKNSLERSFRSKNYENLMSCGEQKFFTMQHARSYSPLVAKKGVLHAWLLAVQSYSGSSMLLVQAAGKFLFEMQHIGYTRRILKKACNKAFFVTGEQGWKQAARLLKQ